MRNSIQDFSLANPIYAGATVSFYTVSGGVKMATLATLYAGLTGTTTLTNPQSLDSDGKFKQPVYIDVPVIATVSGLTIADHDTGIVQAVLSAASLNDVYDVFSASSGSSLIGFIASGTGAVARIIQTKLRDVVSVTDFGAVGDGTTSDQTAIAAAIAACYSSGDWLYWPDGTYLTTATVPNFHDVKHYGPGVVTRGGDSFYIAPASSTTMKLYVATTGSDSNDGLTPSQPLLTTQAAFDRLKNYGSVLEGNWTIEVAAGTYTAETYVFGLRSRNAITLKGPSVGGHPNVPTAFIDGTTPGSRGIGLYFQGYMNVIVQDIKVQNWPAGTGLGIIFDYHCIGYCQNVHTENCGYIGIQASINSRVAISGGIHDGANYNITAYGLSEVTIGYGGSAGANRPIIRNGVVAGVWFAGGFGHLDYCDLQTNPRNIYLTNCSRAHVMGCAMSGATTADIECAGGSTWYNDTVVTNTFSSARPYSHLSGSLEQADWYRAQYDKTNNSWKWGDTALATPATPYHMMVSATGVSPNSSTTLFIDSNGINYLTLGAASNQYAGVTFAKSGSPLDGQVYYGFTAARMYFRTATADQYSMDASSFGPISDDARSLGGAGTRWSVVYAGTGAINTSDAREKQQIRTLSEQEKAVAIRLKGLLRAFKFNDAVAEKGDDARIHFGVIAQDVKAAFEAEGLVAEQYALLCYDEWEETPEKWYEWEDEFDEAGKLVRSAGRELMHEYRSAGNRYGVRYEELLAFVIAAL